MLKLKTFHLTFVIVFTMVNIIVFKLWTTGFGISESKANEAVNGDRINATIYYVLSNSRAYNFEANFPIAEKDKLLALLAYPDSCYNGHYTL